MSFLGTIALAAMFMQVGVDSTGTAIAQPMGEAQLDPSTGNYYQMFKFYGSPPYTWDHARHMVHGYVFQGRVGELASVKTLETHYFLLLQFPQLRQSSSWIGLSVQCNETADTEFVDGTKLADTNFRAWAADAQQKISRTCRDHRLSGEIYPIYYQPGDFGVRWQMGDSKTNIQYMVVEFAKPADEKADGNEGAKPDAKPGEEKKPAEGKAPTAGR